MAISLKNSLLLVWRNRVLRWIALAFLLLVNLYTALLLFISGEDYLIVASATQWLSLVMLVFSLFWCYELFRLVSTDQRQEVLSGIRGALVRVYGSLAAIALAFLLLSFVCILFWNGIACVRAYPDHPMEMFANLATADVLNILCVGVVAEGIAFIFATRLTRLSAYSLSILLVFLNTPVLDFVRSMIRLLPDPVETGFNRVLDLFVLAPQGLTNYPNEQYGLPVEIYRWQLVLAWLFFLAGIVILGMRRRRRAAVRSAGICLTALCVAFAGASLAHGCAYLTDQRNDGVFGDQFYAPYKQTLAPDYTGQFEEPGFRVSDYTMDFTIRKELKARVVMTLDSPHPLVEYPFTLQHGLKIRAVTDGAGNPLDYEREGDFFTVRSPGGAAIEQICVEYQGFSANWFSNEQGVCLPGFYSYYPTPGKRLLVFGSEYQTDYLVNGDQTHFKLKFQYPGTVYCNLPQTRPGEYEGDSSTVTLMGGMVKAQTVGAYTIVYPAYVSLDPQASALGFNLQSITEMDSCLQRLNQLLGTDDRNTLAGNTVFLLANSISSDSDVLIAPDHAVVDSFDGGAGEMLAAETVLSDLSNLDMTYLRDSLIQALRSGLCRWMVSGGSERIFQFQEGDLEPKFDGSRAEEYLKQAGSRYTDEEILKQVYDYLKQENPRQTTEEFLTALAGIGEEAPQYD